MHIAYGVQLMSARKLQSKIWLGDSELRSLKLCKIVPENDT